MRPTNPHEWAMRQEPGEALELWVKDDEAIVNNPLDSKVGIGTTNPQTELQVVGTITADRVFGVDYPDITNRPPVPVQSDWSDADPTSLAHILNKPIITEPVQSDWSDADPTSLAFIQNKPVIPDPQQQSDFAENDDTQITYIRNKPDFLTDADLARALAIFAAALLPFLLAGLLDKLWELFKKFFGPIDPADDVDRTPNQPPDEFEKTIIKIMRQHLNPEFASCQTLEKYNQQGSLKYPYTERDRVFVNFNDSIAGNPFIAPCGGVRLGIDRSEFYFDDQSVLYKIPSTTFLRNANTGNASLDINTTGGNEEGGPIGDNQVVGNAPFIDLRTDTYTIKNIKGNFLAEGGTYSNLSSHNNITLSETAKILKLNGDVFHPVVRNDGDLVGEPVPTETLIDVDTKTYHINSIVGGQTPASSDQWFAAGRASIRTVDIHDFSAGRAGVYLRWPTKEQRDRYDEIRSSFYVKMKRGQNSPEATAAAVMTVRDPRFDESDTLPPDDTTAYMKPVIDYHGNYLGKIYRNQIVDFQRPPPVPPSAKRELTSDRRDPALLTADPASRELTEQERIRLSEAFNERFNDAATAHFQTAFGYNPPATETPFVPVINPDYWNGETNMFTMVETRDYQQPSVARLPLPPGKSILDLNYNLLSSRRLSELITPEMPNGGLAYRLLQNQLAAATPEERAIFHSDADRKYRRKQYDEAMRLRKAFLTNPDSIAIKPIIHTRLRPEITPAIPQAPEDSVPLPPDRERYGEILDGLAAGNPLIPVEDTPSGSREYATVSTAELVKRAIPKQPGIPAVYRNITVADPFRASIAAPTKLKSEAPAPAPAPEAIYLDSDDEERNFTDPFTGAVQDPAAAQNQFLLDE